MKDDEIVRASGAGRQKAKAEQEEGASIGSRRRHCRLDSITRLHREWRSEARTPDLVEFELSLSPWHRYSRLPGRDYEIPQSCSLRRAYLHGAGAGACWVETRLDLLRQCTTTRRTPRCIGAADTGVCATSGVTEQVWSLPVGDGGLESPPANSIVCHNDHSQRNATIGSTDAARRAGR